MRLIPKDFMNAIVPIGIRCDETIQYFATGFFVTKLVNNKAKQFLVTNKHVFKNCSSVVIRMIEKNSERIKEIDLELCTDGIQHYYVHNNCDVDIAVVPVDYISVTSNNIQFSVFDIDSIGCSLNLVQQDLGEGTSVFTLGFPMGWVDIDSNTPIYRGGHIARIGKKEITKTENLLLDIPTFPGSSGSPVLTKPELVIENGEVKYNSIVLLGIVHSCRDFKEPVINQRTQKIMGLRLENSGLSLAHPTELIIEVIDQLTQNVLSSSCSSTNNN